MTSTLGFSWFKMIQAWMCLFCKNLGRHCHWRCVLGGWGASQPRLPLPRLFLHRTLNELSAPNSQHQENITQTTSSWGVYSNLMRLGVTVSDLGTSSIIVASLSQTKVRWLFPVESSLESHARAQSRFSASHIPVDHEGQTSATKVFSYCQLLTVCYVWHAMAINASTLYSCVVLSAFLSNIFHALVEGAGQTPVALFQSKTELTQSQSADCHCIKIIKWLSEWGCDCNNFPGR